MHPPDNKNAPGATQEASENIHKDDATNTGNTQGKPHYGATPEDWIHFDFILGLTDDLLPVVSNPNAKVSDRSTMRTLGKTPSLYNRAGMCVGIKHWTDKIAKSREIDKWSKAPDYGICVQTRRVRALDIDVTDAAVAARIKEVVCQSLPGCAIRSRSNSSKFLIAFVLEGDFPKRIVPVGKDMIEFLGDGQQFIAAGTHTSGVRYEWENLNAIVNETDVESFETIWNKLVNEFGTAPAKIARSRRSTAVSAGSATAGVAGVEQTGNDEILQHLNILSYGRSGEAFIDCPFKAEHSGGVEEDSGTSTVYFLAGTGGYAQGHFKCLHAHCMGRTDHDFIEALGVREAAFDVLRDDEEEAGKPSGGWSKHTSGSWPDPKPIHTELLPVEPFDADLLLPASLKAWVIDSAGRMPCPPDYIAAAAITALGSVIGARCVIKPKSNDDWVVVPNLWGGIVGPPSAKKTPAMNAALKPLDRLIAKSKQCFFDDEGSHKTAMIMHEARKSALEKQLREAAKNETEQQIGDGYV